MSEHRDNWEDAVLERAAVALYRFSTTRGGLDYSRGVAPLLGWDAETLRQDPWHWQRAIHPDDIAQVTCMIESLAPGQFFSIEYRIRHADGRWRWLLDRAVNCERNGAELLIDGIATDVTERKEAERERGLLLEELSGARVAQARAEVAVAENRSWQLIRSIGEAVIGLDNQGRITFFNPAAERLFGHSDASVLGQSLHKLVHHTRADGSACPAQEWIITQSLGHASGHLTGNDTFWRRDGRYFTGEYSFLPLFSENRVSGAVLVIRDVTERERTAQRLSMLSRVVEDGPAAVAMTDTQGRIYYVNSRFTDITGYAEAEVLGQTHRLIASGLTPSETYQSMWAALNAGQAWVGDFLNRHRDGRSYWSHNLITPLRDAGGKLTHYLCISEDITATRELEQKTLAASEATEKALALAEAANQAKSQFLANVSHEIRTPMNAIIGLAELLLRTRLDERQRDYLEKAHRSALLLLGLLNDVLDFSKIESGHLQLDPHPFQFDHVLEQVADLYGDAAAEKGLEFIIDVAPDLPREVIGDSLRLMQVISNLCSNAIKFTTRGEVLLRLEVQPEGAATVQLKVAVSDSGIGMSGEQAEHVFNAFAQADGSTTRRYGGTGLGLSICRNLVERMGGILELETRLGQGSRFSFSVPLELPPLREAPPVPLAGMEILVLCEYAAQHSAVARLLHAQGARVLAPASPAQALVELQQREAAQQPPCVLLADEAGIADPALAAWLKARPAPAAGGPGLILAWRQHIVQPSAWPDAPLIGRPVTRRPLLNAVFALQGKAKDATAADMALQPDLAGARILLVDDYALNVEIVSAFLHDASCAVTVARDGLEALECLHRQQFDAVLMDCQMPQMDGYEATRAIRREPRWQQLPVIAMTANVMEGDREKCFAAGMNDFVPKPVMIEQLLAVLGHHLQREARARPAAAASAKGHGLDLTQLENLDVDAALQSTMGQIDFLARILTIFHTTQHDFAAKFVAARADVGDPEAAGRLAHTLKGAAASMGAQALREAAQALEQACKQNAAADRIEAAFKAVTGELSPVLVGIRRALGMGESQR